MKVQAAEVALTIGLLDTAYGGLMPKGDPADLVGVWMGALRDLDIEEGDLFAAAEKWIGREDSQFAPKPGQLRPLILERQTDRLRTRELATWRANGRLCCTNGRYFLADTGEECDENGTPLPELPTAKQTHGDLAALLGRIGQNLPKPTTDVATSRRS